MTALREGPAGALSGAVIERAHERIVPYIERTPVLCSRRLDEEFGAQLHFKCENLQEGGSFKLRGACNAVFSLGESELAHGVITHSSGNHGAALALAARLRAVPAYVVVPADAARIKRAAMLHYGARIIDCETRLSDREARLSEAAEATGAHFVHPYDDDRVIAGQGTVALEFLQQVPGLDLLLVPVGGGGLISGCALIAKAGSHNVSVIGVEPIAADDARRGFQSGERVLLDAPCTIADGLRASLGVRNFALIRALVDDILCVEEASIVAAMRLLWERLKVVVEPSAAVPFAALLERRLDVSGLAVGIVLSGGNVDLDALPWI